MVLNQEKANYLKDLVIQQYPRWSGFSDKRFIRDSTLLDLDTLDGIELLNELGIRQLADDFHWDDVIDRILHLTRAVNKIYPDSFENDDLFEKLTSKTLDKAAFCESILDLMYGPGSSPDRLDRYVENAEKHELPSGWEFPTLMLMLAHPMTNFFVQLNTMKWFIDFVGYPYKLGSVNGETYARIQRMARDVGFQLRDGGMAKLSDIHRFLRACFKGIGSSSIQMKKASGDDVSQRSDSQTDKNPSGFEIINFDRANDSKHLSQTKPTSQTALDPSAFELLNELETSPLSMKVDKAARETHLEKPALNLVRDVIAAMGEKVRSQFFTVPLTAYGTMHKKTYLNISFYRKGGKWRGEPQIVFNINQDGVDCGFYVERYKGTYVERFLKNFKKHESLIVAWIDEISSEQIGLKANRVQTPNGQRSFQSDSFLMPNDDIRIFLTMSRQDIQGYSRNHVVKLMADAMTKLFPVLQLALDEDPFSEISSVVTEQEPTPEPREEVQSVIEQPLPELAPFDIERNQVETPVVEMKEAAVNDGRTLSLEELDAKQANQVERVDYKEETAELHEAVSEFFSEVSQKVDEEKEPLKTDLNEHVSEIKQEDEPVEENNGQPSGLLSFLAEKSEESKPSLEVEEKSNATPLIEASNVTVEKPELITQTAVLDAQKAVIAELNMINLKTRANTEYTLEQCADDTGIAQNQLKDWVSAIERKGQAVFYGPSGTGKTFLSEKLARHMISNGDGFVKLVQMHARMTYAEFVEAQRPSDVPGKMNRTISIPGRFVEFCHEAGKREDVCVLILDEMHRADINSVIGELLYLLEHRDRDIQLAGGTRFRVPSNVRIIGTMSTADRNNTFLDPAIRRRFAFLELSPRYEVLRHYHRSTPDFPIEELISILQTINTRIANRKMEIGIAYFLRSDIKLSIESVWRTEIEPILNDYFADQPGAADAFHWDAIRAHLSLD